MERITKKKAIEIIGTAAALLVLFGIIWYVSSSVKKTPLISEDGLEYAKATVVEIVKETAVEIIPVRERWREVRM